MGLRTKKPVLTPTEYADSVVGDVLSSFTSAFDTINQVQAYLADTKDSNNEIIAGLQDENSEVDRQAERNSKFLDLIEPFVLRDAK